MLALELEARRQVVERCLAGLRRERERGREQQQQRYEQLGEVAHGHYLSVTGSWRP